YKSLNRVFFFQAEDGIRDFHVTGVQTCALPISAQPPLLAQTAAVNAPAVASGYAPVPFVVGELMEFKLKAKWTFISGSGTASLEIGRASCRERGKIAGGTRSEKRREETR